MAFLRSESLPLLRALYLDLRFKRRKLGVSLDLGSFLPTSLALVNPPVPPPDGPCQRSPRQGPHSCRKPEVASSTSRRSSHRRPSHATSRDHGRTASPPEMSSGIPSTAQGQPPGAQCCPCPSSPSSHLLLLHPHVPLHGQGGRAGHHLLLAPPDSAPVPRQGPSLGPEEAPTTPRWDQPRR